MKTIKAFTVESNISDRLIRAVVRQVGGWDSFKELAEDVTNHGAGGGFSGFIYYTDTIAFTKRAKTLILELAEDQARDCGYDSVYSMIAGFNCLDMRPDEVAEAVHNARSDDRSTAYNALAWYALEEVCRSYVDAVNAQ